MQKNKRIVALILVLLLCHVVFSSMGAVIIDSPHGNCGECCLVCTGIANFAELVKLQAIVFFATLITTAFFAIALRVLRNSILAQRISTLFSLGVSLLN